LLFSSFDFFLGLLCLSVSQRGWEVNLILGTIMFGPKGKKTMDIPKERIISASLLYVRQLEQIV
jgi:26S proteasome regulatory subunit N12